MPKVKLIKNNLMILKKTLLNMPANNYWDQFYQRPLENIPWQTTQADWFKQLIDQREIAGEKDKLF